MTTADYLINAMFVVLVLRQARERRLDLRSLLVPPGAVALVAHAYLRSIPTAGNDLTLVAALAGAGVILGVVSGLATHVSARDGVAVARLGRLAVVLLIAGIASRMAFAFAVGHGAGPAVRSFSIEHHIGAPAWPVALVLMAVLEVTVRVVVVHVRGLRVSGDRRPRGVLSSVVQ
jgi:hypothetical protein